MLEQSDAGVKNRWIEREEELCVVSVKVVVQGKWRIRVLRGVVYKINSRGSRTEPWGTPHIQVWQKEKLLLHLTRKERDDKYDLNQSKAEPWMPNQDDRRVSSMLWSMVSKAAERSRRQRQDTFCEPIALISSFSGVVLNVSTCKHLLYTYKRLRNHHSAEAWNANNCSGVSSQLSRWVSK